MQLCKFPFFLTFVETFSGGQEKVEFHSPPPAQMALSPTQSFLPLCSKHLLQKLEGRVPVQEGNCVCSHLEAAGETSE